MGARILIVRHGHTKENGGSGADSAERIRGWRNVPLDERGVRAAEENGERFASTPIREIWCSPLDRAVETAQALAKYQKAAPKVHPNVSLMPWQLGDMQGQHAKIVLPIMNRYVRNETATPTNGEPFCNFRRRCLAFVQRKIADFDSHGEEEHIASLVTHSRVLQLVKAWISAGCPEDLSIDTDAMINYEGVVPPAGYLWLDIKDAPRKKEDAS